VRSLTLGCSAVPKRIWPSFKWNKDHALEIEFTILQLIADKLKGQTTDNISEAAATAAAEYKDALSHLKRLIPISQQQVSQVSLSEFPLNLTFEAERNVFSSRRTPQRERRASRQQKRQKN
jgi:hypothetical protein